MAIRKIITTAEEKLLRRKAKTVSLFDKGLKILASDMIDTMNRENGVGLAAPQVGILKRLIVCVQGDKTMAIVNPVIVEQSGHATDIEGCLSIPGKRGTVTRPAFVGVLGQDLDGKRIEINAKDFDARVLCHEIDHLDGILYIDRAENIEDI
ncbi:MAG: peptide deformylase [Clostridiales bacterium]|jgi:peptide deformylase|nr:peptide deformylase [Clostridiales bacterium]